MKTKTAITATVVAAVLAIFALVCHATLPDLFDRFDAYAHQDARKADGRVIEKTHQDKSVDFDYRIR